MRIRGPILQMLCMRLALAVRSLGVLAHPVIVRVFRMLPVLMRLLSGKVSAIFLIFEIHCETPYNSFRLSRRVSLKRIFQPDRTLIARILYRWQ
jgi:hypothetical protein